VAGLAGTTLLVFRGEAVGIDDCGAVLALADIAPKRKRLPKCEPALAGKAVLDDGAPKDEHVDAAVAPGGGGVFWQAEWRLGSRRAPGLHPRHATGLQFGDDFGGDLVIKVRPVRAGANAAIMSGHCGSPRR